MVEEGGILLDFLKNEFPLGFDPAFLGQNSIFIVVECLALSN